jgi:hypothetical protein
MRSLTPTEAMTDPIFKEKCLRLWDTGMDTYDIAQALFETEANVERALRLAREERRDKHKHGET